MNITQSINHFIIFVTLFLLGGCENQPQRNFLSKMETAILESHDKKLSFKVFLAKNREEQINGLSHIKNEEFSANDGMLFLFSSLGEREFWMPNTYFNLDIFFLSNDFYIIDVDRNLERYPGEEPRSKVPRTKRVRAHHVLEVKSGSELANKLHTGLKLNLIPLRENN